MMRPVSHPLVHPDPAPVEAAPPAAAPAPAPEAAPAQGQAAEANAPPAMVLMGAPNPRAKLGIRIAQALLAATALAVMASTDDFASVTAFRSVRPPSSSTLYISVHGASCTSWFQSPC